MDVTKVSELKARQAEDVLLVSKWRVLLLLSLAELLAMGTWFSASAVVRPLTSAWGLNAAGQAWLTMSVQAGFVVGSVGFGVAKSVGPHLFPAPVCRHCLAGGPVHWLDPSGCQQSGSGTGSALFDRLVPDGRISGGDEDHVHLDQVRPWPGDWTAGGCPHPGYGFPAFAQCPDRHAELAAGAGNGCGIGGLGGLIAAFHPRGSL